MSLRATPYQYVGADETGTTARKQVFKVPPGVISCYMEGWGAAGGLGTSAEISWVTGVKYGGYGTSASYFRNDPSYVNTIGTAFSQGAGYAAGRLTVTPGATYGVFVGGNGGPGYSAIITKPGGAIGRAVVGGAPGVNGGGRGGPGTGFTYNGHNAVGSSGGGGGGATDIRSGAATSLSDRILVAGGSGGTGGRMVTAGPDAWVPKSTGSSPTPPFGADAATPSGPGGVWSTAVTYFATGWGIGGVGGFGGPNGGAGVPTTGGVATIGGVGGGATKNHNATTNASTADAGGGGKGGTSVAGGARGNTNGQGSNGGSAGSTGQGGTGCGGGTGSTTGGGTAALWACGGGGGGGGYFGGGGGGTGYWDNNGPYKAGGGGGGSNFLSNSFTNRVFSGCARPPGSGAKGASGRGGYARFTYNCPPVVLTTTGATTTFDPTQPFKITFTGKVGADPNTGSFAINPQNEVLNYFTVGWSSGKTTISAGSPPTSQVTVVPTVKTLLDGTTAITYTLPASTVAAGTYSFAVQVTDKDGDTSVWGPTLHLVAAAPGATPPGITSPAANASVSVTDVPVTFTLGSHTGLVGVKGTVTLSGATLPVADNGWQPGNSRVNLVSDPGFTASTEWNQGTVTPAGADTTYPGVSGKDGKTTWGVISDGSAVAKTGLYVLRTNVPYRAGIKIASGTANDARYLMIAANDSTGVLAEQHVDLSGNAAGAYATVDLQFTPSAGGVFFTIQPTDSSGNVGNSESGQITYLADFIIDMLTSGVAATYFDGSHLNGLTGSVSWSGTTNASPSILTGTDATTVTAPFPASTGTSLGATLNVQLLSATDLVNGVPIGSYSETINLTTTAPLPPTVAMTIDNPNGRIQLQINANDGASTANQKVVSFDVYRISTAYPAPGIRIAHNVSPDPTTRIANVYDVPASEENVTYYVRTWSAVGGAYDQYNGTVTTLN